MRPTQARPRDSQSCSGAEGPPRRPAPVHCKLPSWLAFRQQRGTPPRTSEVPMKSLFVLSTLLLAAACTSTPAATSPDGPGAVDGPGALDGPGASDGPGTSGAQCPAATDACMNADNHAQCLEVAAGCDGELLQLESCPLQFACSKPSAGAGSYDPCAGRSCGDGCSECAPDDGDCVETAVVKVCDAEGSCSGRVPTCE
jgi:hypothetical protein